jgi:hypothetical protein
MSNPTAMQDAGTDPQAMSLEAVQLPRRSGMAGNERGQHHDRHH